MSSGIAFSKARTWFRRAGMLLIERSGRRMRSVRKIESLISVGIAGTKESKPATTTVPSIQFQPL